MRTSVAIIVIVFFCLNLASTTEASAVKLRIKPKVELLKTPLQKFVHAAAKEMAQMMESRESFIRNCKLFLGLWNNFDFINYDENMCNRVDDEFISEERKVGQEETYNKLLQLLYSIYKPE